MNKNAGFTLVELLVVVLMIGILAAVALPQYQKAVAKSRLSGLISLASSVSQAEQVYYAANGEYTIDVTNLDISLPSGFTLLSETVGSAISYRKDFVTLTFYAQGHGGAARVAVEDSRVPAFILQYFDPKRPKVCGVPTDSTQVELGKSICATYGASAPEESGSTYFYYRLN